MASVDMEGMYYRGEMIWFSYHDVTGDRVQESSGYRRGQEKIARKCLDKIKSRIEAEKSHSAPEDSGSLTFRRYAEKWLAKRTNSTKDDDESRMRLHVYPVLGNMALTEIRPRHIRDLVERLREMKVKVGDKEEKKHAPRSLHNIYGTLHQLMHDAQVDELIDTNPCVLKKGDLPKKVDKDPTWRKSATFAREEIEKIISDERIPEDRRVVYALIFLGAMRFGESAALRWRHYDATLKPLGKFDIEASYNVKTKEEKATKTDNPRTMPVHPTLAKILAEWKLGGWERMFGHPPKVDDLIVPSRNGVNRSVNHALKKFHQDLTKIGLRTRRQHDARRAFISLAQADGARKDVLKWVTHGPGREVMDLYTTLPWETLCEAVSCLKIRRLEGQVIALPVAAAQGGGLSLVEEQPEPVTPAVTVIRPKDKSARNHDGIGRSREAGWTGLEPAASGVTGRRYNRLNYHPRILFSLLRPGGRSRV
jgi:hypothetical protein